MTEKVTYTITVNLNGETYNKRSSDIIATLMSIRPQFVHTDMYLTIKKGKRMIERKIKLIDVRAFFQDETRREILLNNLLLQQLHG